MYIAISEVELGKAIERFKDGQVQNAGHRSQYHRHFPSIVEGFVPSNIGALFPQGVRVKDRYNPNPTHPNSAPNRNPYPNNIPIILGTMSL